MLKNDYGEAKEEVKTEEISWEEQTRKNVEDIYGAFKIKINNDSKDCELEVWTEPPYLNSKESNIK